MFTVGQQIEFVSKQLSDQKPQRTFTRWLRQDLLNYLNLGLKEIGAYRAEAFSQDILVPLAPGTRQTLPFPGDISAIVDKTGTPVLNTDADTQNAFSRFNPCPPKLVRTASGLEYVLQSYSIDTADASMFFVSPPVPQGANAIVTVTIQGKAPEYKLADWDKPIAMQDKYANNLVSWMMAEAYRMDTESQVSAQLSTRLFSEFYQAMGVTYKMDSARGSGYYRGEKGDGDPRAMT